MKLLSQRGVAFISDGALAWHRKPHPLGVCQKLESFFVFKRGNPLGNAATIFSDRHTTL